MLDQATADLTEVLDLEPSHLKAMYAGAACLNLKGDFELANGMSSCSYEMIEEYEQYTSENAISNIINILVSYDQIE
jgi:hypothetical protein